MHVILPSSVTVPQPSQALNSETFGPMDGPSSPTCTSLAGTEQSVAILSVSHTRAHINQKGRWWFPGVSCVRDGLIKSMGHIRSSVPCTDACASYIDLRKRVHPHLCFSACRFRFREKLMHTFCLCAPDAIIYLTFS